MTARKGIARGVHLYVRAWFDSLTRELLSFADGVVLVGLLDDGEGLLLFSLIGDEAFAVEAVLDTGELAYGGAEVHEDPRAHAAELGNFVEHHELVAVDAGLVLLGPALGFGAVKAGLRSAAELGDDEGLVVGDLPLRLVGVLGLALVPADVLVEADDVERFA